MALFVENDLVETIRDAAHPLSGDVRDYDPLLEAIGDAHFVLLGEASHGTHDFYRERAHSKAFTFLIRRELKRFLDKIGAEDETTWLRDFAD